MMSGIYNYRRKPSSAAQGDIVRVTGEDLEARRAQRLGTITILKTGRTPLEVVAIAAQAEERADEVVTAVVRREPPPQPLACAEGCSWCCHQRVGVAVPEV